MRTAVITPVSGRHTHLRMQRAGLRESTLPIDAHVVVAMDDPDVASVLSGPELAGTVLAAVPKVDGRLPLSRARNTGAALAVDGGAELLVFLDVDCVPNPHLVKRYTQTAGQDPAPRLLCGPVAYLPPPPPGGYQLGQLPRLAAAHPARPRPAVEETIRDGDPRLFWSLSFAVTVSTWQHTGGFCEQYTGYGGEDTDYAQSASNRGVRLDWVGGAWAYHQFHASTDPPVQHLDDILRNAGIFHNRWGWWPMTGWLEAFEQSGLVRYDECTDRWLRTAIDPS